MPSCSPKTSVILFILSHCLIDNFLDYGVLKHNYLQVLNIIPIIAGVCFNLHRCTAAFYTLTMNLITHQSIHSKHYIVINFDIIISCNNILLLISKFIHFSSFEIIYFNPANGTQNTALIYLFILIKLPYFPEFLSNTLG